MPATPQRTASGEKDAGVPARLNGEFRQLVRLAAGLQLPSATVDGCARLYLAAREFHADASREHEPQAQYFRMSLLHGDGNVPETVKARERAASIYRRGRQARQQLCRAAEGPVNALVKLEGALSSRAESLPPRARELGQMYLKDARESVKKFAETMRLEDSLLKPRRFGEWPPSVFHVTEQPPTVFDITMFWWSLLIHPQFYKAEGQKIMHALARAWKLTTVKNEDDFERMVRRALRKIVMSKRTGAPGPPSWAIPKT